MSFQARMLSVAVLAALTLAPPAQAGWLQELNRSFGLGWSDGYHSRTTCPPKRHHGQYYSPAVPSWIYGEETVSPEVLPAESLPAPATSSRRAPADAKAGNAWTLPGG